MPRLPFFEEDFVERTYECISSEQTDPDGVEEVDFRPSRRYQPAWMKLSGIRKLDHFQRYTYSLTAATTETIDAAAAIILIRIISSLLRTAQRQGAKRMNGWIFLATMGEKLRSDSSLKDAIYSH